ncbi:T9SS type A sorting domain-containing protein [Flavobacterium sp. FlaQc-47]|uniref:T9SS type A sorting domain-containing protein n=1 Tax=Flavobacterium sp. FlaQc-47 TaxID=3374180 RepID=UPI003756CE39
MRIMLLFFIMLFCCTAQAQTKITFGYDAAGNQTGRILCINCLSKPAKEVKEIEAVTSTDPDQFFEEDQISYYPNPVKEELYLQWNLKESNYVTSVYVYSVTGQILRIYTINEQLRNLNIPFQSYSAGVYIVLLSYKNGGEKSIKIIKQ